MAELAGPWARLRAPGVSLQHRLFCVNGAGQLRVVLDAPKALEDNICWTHLDAYRRIFPLPRDIGAEGWVIQHFVWDRALAGPTYRHVRQLHKAAEQSLHRRPSNAASHELMRLLSWQTPSPCANHDIHNSMKWSLMQFTQALGVLKAALVCVDALRNSYASLVLRITGWLGTVVGFEDFLGLEPEAFELAMLLQARYVDDRFLLSRRLQDDGSFADMVVTLPLSTWSCRRWAESRWLSMDPSCRVIHGLRPPSSIGAWSSPVRAATFSEGGRIGTARKSAGSSQSSRPPAS